MKVLIFNHHPEHIWEFKRSFEANGIDPYIATEKLTFDVGSKFCTIGNNGKWLRGYSWFDPKELFEDNFKYSDTLEDFDYIVTMREEIANNIQFDPKKLFLIAPVSWDLLGMRNKQKYTKVSAHALANKFDAEYIPRFVQMYGNIPEKKYITQLIHGFQNSIFTSKLIELKNKGYDVIIAGGPGSPDGEQNDWQILKQTSLLVHYKSYGVVCTSILKALDCGIPIYMTKENREQNGLQDLPDDFFFFSEEYSIEDAYKKSKETNNKYIQNTFRKLKNLKITSERLCKLL